MATNQSKTQFIPGVFDHSGQFYVLWAIALLTYGLGDTLSTLAIITAPDLKEANILIQFIVTHYGQAGLIGLKTAVFVGCFAISTYGASGERDAVLYYLPTILLGAVGAFTTIFNLGLLWT